MHCASLLRIVSRVINTCTSFSTPVLRVWECARKLWETLRRSSQNLAIWASQRMLFDPTKTFCFFYIYFIAKVLCCFGIRTEEIQLTALWNFQVSKVLVVAAEKILFTVCLISRANVVLESLKSRIGLSCLLQHSTALVQTEWINQKHFYFFFIC